MLNKLKRVFFSLQLCIFWARGAMNTVKFFIKYPGRFVSEWKDLKAVLRMLRYRVFVENAKFRRVLAGIKNSLPRSN